MRDLEGAGAYICPHVGNTNARTARMLPAARAVGSRTVPPARGRACIFPWGEIQGVCRIRRASGSGCVAQRCRRRAGTGDGWCRKMCRVWPHRRRTQPPPSHGTGALRVASARSSHPLLPVVRRGPVAVCRQPSTALNPWSRGVAVAESDPSPHYTGRAPLNMTSWSPFACVPQHTGRVSRSARRESASPSALRWLFDCSI